MFCFFMHWFLWLKESGGAERSLVSCYCTSTVRVLFDMLHVWAECLDSRLVWLPELEVLAGWVVRITLLYTCGWMNDWKHPAWHGIQLTSIQLAELCTSIWASICHHIGCACVCIYVYMCVFRTGYIICLCLQAFSLFVCEGAECQLRPAVCLPMEREGVCIDIRVE